MNEVQPITLDDSMIIGYIDYYGAVHSVQRSKTKDVIDNTYTHCELFGPQSRNRWRWTDILNIWNEENLDCEDICKIENHLKRIYGIINTN